MHVTSSLCVGGSPAPRILPHNLSPSLPHSVSEGTSTSSPTPTSPQPPVSILFSRAANTCGDYRSIFLLARLLHISIHPVLPHPCPHGKPHRGKEDDRSSQYV
ncbi:hypothetical protein TcG_03824 [Trypanosoma cruzi]|nr:hypothetical protein TcG_03824 [Trypanosoma cruzi]